MADQGGDVTLSLDRIGDKGQRFVVQGKGFPLRDVEGWQDLGYSNDRKGADRLMEALSMHPSVTEIRVLDLRSQWPAPE